ncbi:MAG TPA: flagellar M-ring protein FliF C-terminal domain-containing protein [Lachnospiraceae bacterium]|nr:flagellar M-ring protein FliF C-terminal domain-containing protein [Lachnospiraceae bacterium]
MLDNLKKLPAKLLEWWNKFTTKQRTIIISVTAGVILALTILTTVLMKPQYTPLVTSENTTDASVIKDLLKGGGLTYKVSPNGLEFQVITSQLSDANLLLGANNIPTTTYDLDTALGGGFSTTESDKKKKYKQYLESKMSRDLEAYSFVKSATVQIDIPDDNGTLISQQEESYAAITLNLKGDFTSENAQAMAKFVSVALGNDTTNNIVILDTDANLYFSGEDNFSITGNASTQLTVKQQAENIVKADVKKVLNGTGQFSLIEVSPNLTIDFSTLEEVNHTYTPADGQTQGVLSHEDIFSSESTGGTSGVPGTDSNNETTYVIPDNEYSNSSQNEESRDYLPNELITSKTIPPGLIVYDNSSIAVATTTYKVIRESDAKNQGLLDGITWEEYKLANGDRTKLQVDMDFIDIVAKATGIDSERISFVAYEENMFVDKEGLNVSATDIVQIILIIVILALLAFVVLRSMRSARQQDQEEELSVERLLQSTPEPELENIDFEEKSEARRIIEKFVDENPDAVANLLRNWLNEDWG